MDQNQNVPIQSFSSEPPVKHSGGSNMSPKKVLPVLAILLLAIGITVYLTGQRTQTEQQANTQQEVPACTAEQARCLWDASENTTQYEVTVTNVDTGAVIKSGIVNAPTTAFVFPAAPGGQYSCTVIPKNSCGDGVSATATGGCTVVSITPTLTPEASASATPTVEVSGTVTPTHTPTPTTVSNTATPAPSNTPQPTHTPTVTPTNPPSGPTSTPRPTSTGVPTNTPEPTVPPFVGGGDYQSPTPTPLTKLPDTGFTDNVVLMTFIGSIIAITGTFLYLFM